MRVRVLLATLMLVAFFMATAAPRYKGGSPVKPSTTATSSQSR